MYTPKPYQRLFFDIETTANPKTVALMPDPSAPGNLKDPLKIEQAIIDKKSEQIAAAPLDPDYGQVLCIGYTLDPYQPAATLHGDEPAMLRDFWRILAEVNGRCVGYNIIGFDLPYLLRRSFAFGIQPPIIPSLARFRTDPVTDLMAILYNWDNRSKGLKTVAKLYGIPNAAEGVSGADVASLPIEKVLEYCKSDVALVCQLYNRMNGVYFSL